MTHTFRLTSNVECEVKELMTKHQGWLSEENADYMKQLDKVLLDVIVRIGSVKPTQELMDKLLSSDKKKILVELRMFSLDEPLFEFEYTYMDNGQKAVHPLTLDLSQAFATKPLQVMGEDGLEDAGYSEYSEIDRYQHTTLPSGQEVRWSLLDGAAEKAMNARKKSERNINMLIEVRNVVFFQKTENDSVPVRIDVSKLSLKDSKHLREQFKLIEGQVDTEVMFEHPKADFLPHSRKNVVIDLLSLPDFFFPAGT